MMKSLSVILFSTCLLITIPATAHEGTHVAGEHPTQNEQQAAAVSRQEMWVAITGLHSQLETATPADLHDLTDKLSVLLGNLKSSTVDMAEQRRIRLHSAIDQAVAVTGELHEAADEKAAAKVAESKDRLQAALRLVQALGGAELK